MRTIYFRAARLLVLIVTVPLVLVLTRCSSDNEESALQARKWCEGTMAIFESDRDAFFTRHAERMHHGLLVVRPGSGVDPSPCAIHLGREVACRILEGFRFTGQLGRLGSGNGRRTAGGCRPDVICGTAEQRGQRQNHH